MEKLTAKERRLVNIAWKQLEKFICDWKHSPYKWDTERDIQAELASRLKQAYGKLNDYKAHYKRWATKGYRQRYSRVCCEPLVHYGKRIRHPSKPDIVVFKDLEDPKLPPDDGKGKKNRPILWLCEIKYNTEMTANPTNPKKDWDIAKLKYLIDNGEAYYACWFVLYRRKDGDNERHPKSGRFRKYIIKLPSKMLKTLQKEECYV